MKHTATAILLLALIVAIALPALAAEELGVVYGGGLHLRTAPSLEAEIINTYPSGTHVQVTAVEGSWYAVTVEDGQKGYMEADYVYITSVGIIDNGDAYVNLRTSPSRDASIIGEYASGTQVTLLSEDTEGWAYVDIDGVWGYMDLEFIKPLPLGSDILTTPAPQAGGDSSLATNGENDVVQQIGQSESAISSTELLSYAVY